MSPDEASLFSKIDSARQSEGCAPLRRNNSLSDNAEDEAGSRAADNDFSASGSKAAAGGKDMSAQTAFDRLMDQSSDTVLNCGLDELGVGRGTAKYCSAIVCIGGLGQATRVGWVVDFN